MYSKKERKKSNLEKISKKEKNNHQGYPSSRGNLTRNAGRRNLSPFLACHLYLSLSLSLSYRGYRDFISAGSLALTLAIRSNPPSLSSQGYVKLDAFIARRTFAN